MRKSFLLLFSCLLSISADYCAGADSEQHGLDPASKTDTPKVESKFKSDMQGLRADHHLSLLEVTVAAGRTEPAHTHPGDEILFCLSGHGAVYVDGVRHELKPGAVVHVRRAQKKSLSNETGTEPLRVLAYLVLEKGHPTIELVGAP